MLCTLTSVARWLLGKSRLSLAEVLISIIPSQKVAAAPPSTAAAKMCIRDSPNDGIGIHHVLDALQCDIHQTLNGMFAHKYDPLFVFLSIGVL